MDAAEGFNRFCEDRGIVFKATRIAKRPGNGDPGEWGAGARHFRCTFTRRGVVVRVYFSQGSGHTEDPTLAEVLWCLQSDFYGTDETTFEDWARDLGYDTDSRKAEEIFHAVKRQRVRMARILDREDFAALAALEAL